MQDHVYRPGEKVPEPGIYRVVHYRHRLPHEVTISEPRDFPACRVCGDGVRFTLVRTAITLENDRDLSPTNSV